MPTGTCRAERKQKKKQTIPFFRQSSFAEEHTAGRTGQNGGTWLINAKSEGDSPDVISLEISQIIAERLVRPAAYLKTNSKQKLKTKEVALVCDKARINGLKHPEVTSNGATEQQA